MSATQRIRSLAISAMLLGVVSWLNASIAWAQFGGGPNGNFQGGNPNASNPFGGNHSGGQGHHAANNHHGNHNNGGFNGFGYWGPYGFGFPFLPQNYNYGFYQRPYPYHLDYYKMRYNGSYEPYSGNLYGTPMVQQYVGPTIVNPPYAPSQSAPTPYVPGPQNAGGPRNYAGAYFW